MYSVGFKTKYNMIYFIPFWEVRFGEGQRSSGMQYLPFLNCGKQ